ncbi:MAG: NAD(P)/FAD-dependent oxidoreductase [Planctomycetota bacterium]|nr:NAD(P)/FAD-dependent oxidoreductase [Planctomycetota bacterium]
MPATPYDLVVLGGGNAFGLVTEAANAGLRVALIEKDLLGGTCPNRGCIPTKLLLGYADVANAVRRADRFHVDADLKGIDGRALLAETFGATRQTDGKLERALPDNVTLYRGRGRFVGERELEVNGERVRGERVVVSTGSRPRRLDVPGLAGTPYWTSDDLFQMDELPQSIAIVGGGCIGVEMGSFLNGVGVDVTVIHRDAQLFDYADAELRAKLTKAFTARVPTMLESTVTRVEHDARGFTIHVEGPDGTTTARTVERLLYAVGRVPNADDIGLELAGIETTERGHLKVDGHLQTTAEGVYGLGDVVGNYMLTHTATFEGAYLARTFLEGETAPIDYGAVPAACFTTPELAWAGPTEQQLQAKGIEYLSASVPYTSAAKGRALKEEHGLCKLLFEPDGTLLAAHIVGEHASILLHEVIPVLKWRPHISSLTDIIHVHPSLSEVVRNAARKAKAMLKEAVPA